MDSTTQRLMMGSNDKQPFFGILSTGFSVQYFTSAFKFDSNRNAYICGSVNDTNNSSLNRAVLVKLKCGFAGASVEWARSISTAGNESYYDVAISDDGASIYVVGPVSGYSGIVKYNSSGTIQWVRYLMTSGASFGVTVDSSGDVYITGYSRLPNRTTNDAIIAKYNSSGTIQWQKYEQYGDVTFDSYGTSIVSVPSSGGFVIAGGMQQSGLVPDILVTKFTTAGNVSWKKIISTTSGDDIGYDIGINSAGDVYVLGYTNGQGAGSNDIYLTKLNGTNGTTSWQRSLGTASSEIGYDITVDSSTGDCYILGQASSTVAVVAKYNTSGTIQWQRSISISTDFNVNDISLGPDGMIYILFHPQGQFSNSSYFIRIDPNGNGTGTFADITYSAISYTDAARTLFNTSEVVLGGNTTFTEADASGLITEGSESVNFDGA